MTDLIELSDSSDDDWKELTLCKDQLSASRSAAAAGQLDCSLDELPDVSSPSSDDDELPSLAARLGGVTASKLSTVQRPKASTKDDSDSDIQEITYDKPQPKEKKKQFCKTAKKKSNDFYSDSSDVEIELSPPKIARRMASPPKSVRSLASPPKSAESTSQLKSLTSDLRSQSSVADSVNSQYSAAYSVSSEAPTDSLDSQLDSQLAEDIDSQDSNLSTKERKKLQQLQARKRKEEEKERKKKEREEKKRGEEMEKIRKRALQEAARTLKPQECLKHITVCMSPDILKTSASTGILDVLQHASIRYEVQEQVFPGLVTFWREVTQVKEKADSQEIESVTNEQVEDTVLLLLPAEEFIQLVAAYKRDKLGLRDTNDVTLFDRVCQVEEVLENRKVTVICQGVDRYLRMLKDARKGRRASPSDLSRMDVEEALVDLQFRCSSNVRLIETDVEMAQLVHCCTKAVANAPFKKNRLQSGFSFHADTGSSVKVSREGQGLLKVWRQQLQQFRSVSAEVANTIIAKYPSPKSLVQAYRSCGSEKEAELLLQDLEVRRGAGVMATTRRVGKELSRRVYQLLTVGDENFILK